MYISGSGNLVTEYEMIKQLFERIIKEKEAGNELSIIIGCDSQELDPGVYVFAVAIALHIIGKGGIFFIRRFKKYEKMHLSTRLYTEVQVSVEEAEKLNKEYGIMDIVDNTEIHCDAGTEGKSSDYMTGLKGVVRSYGYNGFAKPEAPAASKIADRYTK